MEVIIYSVFNVCIMCHPVPLCSCIVTFNKPFHLEMFDFRVKILIEVDALL